MNTQFSADSVRDMLTNLIYVGIGPYKAIIEDDLWIDVNVRMIEEKGAQTVIEITLKHFEEAFSGLFAPNAKPYIQQAEANPRIALRRLLVDLRQLAPQMAGEIENTR